MRKTSAVFAGVLLLLAARSAVADIFWDNNIHQNGLGFRGVSEPAFPNVRVADDFMASPWRFADVHVAVVEDDAWTRGPLMQVFIYEDNAGSPGSIAVDWTGSYTFEDQGERLFDRQVFHYWADVAEERLFFQPGETYWFGFRTLGGSGTGSNYWLTSDGGPDGINSLTGFFSTDGGDTWQNEGDDWHYAFELGDIIPAPGALGVLAFAGLFTRARRRG